jgi:hypothetical protein
MNAAQAIAAIANLLPGSPGTPDETVAAATAHLEALSVSRDRALKALERAAANMDAAGVELTQKRNRAQSAQAFADMTDIGARLVNSAADVRNVLAVAS